MRWNKDLELWSLSHISSVNTNSAAEFGNKVQSCGTEDAKIFHCYIGSNMYAEDRAEYLSVYLVAAISATVYPASVAALST